LPDARWLYLGRDVRFLHEVRNLIGGHMLEQSYGEKLQAIAHEKRADYIEYLGRLASGLDPLFWWLTSISEKNPNNSRFFLYSCYVNLVIEEIQLDPCDMIILCETQGLARTIEKNIADRPDIVLKCQGFSRKAILNSAGNTIIGIAKKIHLIVSMTSRILLSRILSLARPGNTLRGTGAMIFSWADARSFASLSYTDIYCGALGNQLRKRGERVTYLVSILPTFPFLEGLVSLWKFRREVLLAEEFLHPWDPLLAWFRVWRNRQEPKEIPPMAGIDVSGIVEEELLKERFSVARERAFLFFLIGRNLAGYSDFSIFIHPFENHAWEKMFAISLKRYSPSVKVIGYLHSIAMPMYTCESMSSWEREHGPHPDLILVNGPGAKATLIESGFDANAIHVGGSFREFSIRPDRIASGKKIKDRILLPLAADLNEALELVYLTLEAVSEMPWISVMIKAHPIIKPGELRRSLPTLPLSIRLCGESTQDLLADTDLVLYTSSTVAVEAFAMGIPVIHVGSNLNIDRNIFEGLAWVPSASKARDLGLAISQALGKEEGTEGGRRALIESLFSPIDGKIMDRLVEWNFA